MAYNIGLNVIETDGTGTAALVGAATSVAGFNITTRRGVQNRPVRVTSFKQFTDQFGGMFAASYGAYMVKGFFDNGGQNAYINRIVASDPTTGAATASHKFSDGTANTLEVDAGQYGAADPGTWGNDLYAKIDSANGAPVGIRETAAATLAGTPLADTIDLTALPSVSVNVDGETTATVITFTAADFADVTHAKLAEIASAINKRTTKLTAAITSDKRLSLTSTGQTAHLNKTFTRVEVTAAVAALGLTAVAANGTAAPITATGTTLTASDEFNAGEAIQITDGVRTEITKILAPTPTPAPSNGSPPLPTRAASTAPRRR